MTDLPDAGPPTGAGWTDEVDEHLAEAREQDAGVDRATTDRTQATTDRAQATTDRDQATTDRTRATADRTQADIDRTETRRSAAASRADVVSLGKSVADLAASVAELHDLILATMEKADRAQTEAAANPSRRRVYWIASALAALALVLAGTGALIIHEQQVQNYKACNERNAAQAQSDAFLGKLNEAVQRSRSGSLLARNLGVLLTPVARQPVTCHRPMP